MSENAETGFPERLCAYCGDPYSPKGDGQMYCRPSHRAKAASRRRRGLDPVAFPVLTVLCSWCGTAFDTRDPRQRCCCAVHRENAIVCDRKEDFLTEEAVAVAARLRTAPGLLVLEYYRCPRPGTAHWHLRRDKRLQRTRPASERIDVWPSLHG